MRFGLIGRVGPDMLVDNVADSLTRMGHDVSHLGSTRYYRGGRLGVGIGALAATALPGMVDRLHRRMARSARDLECDAVITTEGTLSPRAVEALQRERIPVALWFPDAVSNLGRQQMLTAPYTALFFKDPLLVQRLRDTLGVPVWYLPEACNPRWHLPLGASATERTIVVVGNLYPSRLMLLRRLHEAGIPLTLYGAPAPRWASDVLPPDLHTGRYVAREEKSRVFREAAGVLNNLHPAEMHGVNCRLFEATAAGAAVLCEHRPVLGDLFDIDREVMSFRCFAELVDRAQQLLADAQLTTKVGDAATIRAHADHTYETRLNTLLEKLW